MEISKLIGELESLKEEHGEIEVQLMNTPKEGDDIIAYESFFIVPELYDPDEEHEEEYWLVNLRSWPY